MREQHSSVLARNESILSAEQAFAVLDGMADQRELHINGGTIYAGQHSEFGKIRLILTNTGDGVMIQSN